MSRSEADRRLMLIGDGLLRGPDMPTLSQSATARVELVPGPGNRFVGQFCVMSLVASLAGEQHSDAPETASRFIRSFALTLNDSLPNRARQRLTLFAPRIVSTNDGQDECRLSLMRRILDKEILPRLADDIFNDRLPRILWSDPTILSGGERHPAALYLAAFANGAYSPAGPDTVETVAEAVARLLVYSALLAPSQRTTNRYVATAIDVLDRLCDIAEPTSGAGCARTHKIPPLAGSRNEVNAGVAGGKPESGGIQNNSSTNRQRL